MNKKETGKSSNKILNMNIIRVVCPKFKEKLLKCFIVKFLKAHLMFYCICDTDHRSFCG